MDRAVTRGRERKVARPIRYIGVDKKSFRKGHVYHTIVCDLERSTVERVAEDRRVESVGSFFERLTSAQREAIEAVAMDMWDQVEGVRLQEPAPLPNCDLLSLWGTRSLPTLHPEASR